MSLLNLRAVRLVTPEKPPETVSAWPRRLWLSCRDHRANRSGRTSLDLV